MKRFLVCLMATLLLAAVLPMGQVFAETKPILGDANGDGRITAADASGLLRITVGMASLADGLAADCDFSGAINASDSSCLLRYVVGLQTFVVPGDLLYLGDKFDLERTVTYDKDTSYDLSKFTFTNSNCTVKVSLEGGSDLVCKNAGEYRYAVTLDHPDYIIPGAAEGRLCIEKATYDMSGVTFEDSIQYRDDDSDEDTVETHVITITGTLPEGVSVAYYCNGEPFEFASQPGKYTIVAKFTGDYENYHEIPDMTAVLEICKRWTGEWMSIG